MRLISVTVINFRSTKNLSTAFLEVFRKRLKTVKDVINFDETAVRGRQPEPPTITDSSGLAKTLVLG